MPSIRFCVALLAGLMAGSVFAQSAPERYLRELSSIEDMGARQKRAAELLKSVNPARISPEEGIAYARVYAVAGLFKRQRVAATRYLRTKPTGDNAYMAYRHIFEAALGDRDAETAMMALKEAKPLGLDQKFDLAHRASTYGAYVIGLKDKQAALQAIRLAETKVDPSALDDARRQRLVRDKAISEAQIQSDLNYPSSASKVLRDAAAQLQADSDDAKRLLSLQNLFGSIGKAAPSLTLEGGGAKSVSAAGKVTLLYFYGRDAKAEEIGLDQVKALSGNLNVIGIGRILASVTDKAGEANAIRQYAKDQGIGFETVIADRTAYNAYGVASVPTFVVVGRDGKIARVLNGYAVDAFQELRAFIAKL